MLKSKYLGLAVGAALLGLAACATTVTSPNGGTTTTTTVTMTPEQLGAEAQSVVAAFKAGISAYELQAPTAVNATLQTQITTAENAASALAGSISTADVSTAATDATSLVNGLAAVADQIPGLPPDVQAGVIAFQVLTAALEPLLNPTPAPAALMGAVLMTPVTKIGTIPVGGHLVVQLVPNA